MKTQVITVPDVLTSIECETICNYCSHKCQPSKVGSTGHILESKPGSTNTEIRHSMNSFITHNDTKLSNIMRKVADCLVQVSAHAFDFPINYIEPIQYSEYTEGMYYNEHCDCGESIEYDRDISASVFLSPRENYKGGNLSFPSKEGNTLEVNEKQGSMSIFPSMMIHKVNKVKSGKRSSLVLWSRRPAYNPQSVSLQNYGVVS